MDASRSRSFTRKSKSTTVPQLSQLMTCPFRKSHPAWIGVMGENHYIILGDVCGLARARNVRRRLVQVAVAA
jgi:hypothetical protein